MKKIFSTVGIFILLGIIGYLTFYFFSKKPQGNIQSIQSGLLPSATSSDFYAPAVPFPTTPTMTIGTNQGIVEVKNFYNSVVGIEEGLLILADADNYEIAYDRSNSNFLIYLRNPSLKNTRQNAETDFLEILGINQENACKLNVQESALPSSQLGENQNLSFCLNKLQ